MGETNLQIIVRGPIEAYSCNPQKSRGSASRTRTPMASSRRYLLKGANLPMHSHAHVGVSTMESSRRFAGASSLSGVREMIALIF